MSSPIQVRFLDHNLTFEAAIGESILDLADRNDLSLDHACGGVCACATCHVKILTGAEHFTEASEDEEDQLDSARDLDLNSRLSCQARIKSAPQEGATIDIEIPTWNINLVQEG
jgi:2Fe-2S ferredoxin